MLGYPSLWINYLKSGNVMMVLEVEQQSGERIRRSLVGEGDC